MKNLKEPNQAFHIVYFSKLRNCLLWGGSWSRFVFLFLLEVLGFSTAAISSFTAAVDLAPASNRRKNEPAESIAVVSKLVVRRFKSRQYNWDASSWLWKPRTLRLSTL